MMSPPTESPQPKMAKIAKKDEPAKPSKPKAEKIVSKGGVKSAASVSSGYTKPTRSSSARMSSAQSTRGTLSSKKDGKTPPARREVKTQTRPVSRVRSAATARSDAVRKKHEVII